MKESAACPNCGKQYSIGPEMIGKTATCGVCKTSFILRAPPSAPTKSASTDKGDAFFDAIESDISSAANQTNEARSGTASLTDSNEEWMPVTTSDLKRDYSVIGPVYFQISNKGLFSNALRDLTRKYQGEIDRRKKQGQANEQRPDWGFLYGEWSVGQNDFDSAFYVAVQELKLRAERLGADAIVGMRQDIDLDTNGFAFFYLQMYGTAVKYR
jgi:transcription elongation factor Elf1